MLARYKHAKILHFQRFYLSMLGAYIKSPYKFKSILQSIQYYFDMNNKSQTKNTNWLGGDYYESKSKGMKLASEYFQTNKGVPLDPKKFKDQDYDAIRQCNAILQAAPNPQIKQAKDLMNYLHISQGKYVEYDSGQQSSSKDYINSGLQSPNEIIDSISGVPTKKKVFFVTKLNLPEKMFQNTTIQMQMTKGFRNKSQPYPLVYRRLKKGNICLYEVETISNIKKYQFQLKIQNHQLKEQIKSIQLSFGGNVLLTDINFSYDDRSGKKIKTNRFEQLVMFSLLKLDEEDTSLDNILNQCRKSKNKILQGLQLDELIEKQVMNSPDEIKYRYLLILNELIDDISITSEISQKNAYLYKLLQREAQSYICEIRTINELSLAIKMLHIHLHSYQKQKNMENIKKIIEKLWETKNNNIVYECLDYCLKNDLNLFKDMFTFSTLLEKIENGNPNFVESLPNIMLSLYYYALKTTDKNFICTNFINIFNGKVITNLKKTEETQFLAMEKHFKKLFELNNFQFTDLDNLQRFYSVYEDLIRNNVMKELLNIQNLKTTIRNRFKSLINEKITHPVYFKTLWLFYLQKNDPQIANKNQLIDCIEKYKRYWDQQNSKDLVPLIFYQLLQRKEFKIATEITKTVTDILLKKKLQESISILSNGLTNDIIVNKQSHKIINQIVEALMNKEYESKDINKILSNNSDLDWHYNFKYNIEISILMIEFMITKIKQKISDPSRINTLKRNIEETIRTRINNPQKKQQLLAVILQDSIAVTKQSIRNIIIKDQNRMMALIKILRKQENISFDLERSLGIFKQQIINKNISYNEILSIISMSNKNKPIFTELLDKKGQIMQMLKQYERETAAVIEKSKKYVFFLQMMVRQYEIIVPASIFAKIKKTQEYIYKESISQDLFEDLRQLEILNEQVLNCFLFPNFFGQQKLKNNSLQKTIQVCNKKLNFLRNKVSKIINAHKQKKLIFSDLFHEYIQQSSSEEDIQKFVGLTAQSYIAQDILKIYREIKNIGKSQPTLFSLKKFLQRKQKAKNQVLDNLLSKINKIKGKDATVKISDLPDLKKAYENMLTQKGFPQNEKSRERLIKSITLYEQYKGMIKQLFASLNYVSQMKSFVQYENDDQMQQFDISPEDLDDYEFLVSQLKKIQQLQEKGFDQMFRQLKRKTLKLNEKYYERLGRGVQKMKQINQLKKIVETGNKGDNKIQMILKDSKFVVYIKPNLQCEFKLTIKHGEVEKQISWIDIQKIRDQVTRDLINFENKPEQEKNKDEESKLKSFQSVCEEIQQVIKLEKEYVQNGEAILGKQKCKIILIKNGDVRQLKKYSEALKEEVNNWKNQLQELYDNHFKITLLQNYLLRQFFMLLSGKVKVNDVIHRYTGLCNQQSIQNFIAANKAKIIQSEKKAHNSSLEILKLIKTFFDQKEAKQSKQPQPSDMHMNKADIIICPEDKGFLRGLTALGPQRIKKLKPQQVLFCNTQTTIQDVQSFIDRALRDIANQYVIIDLKQLDLFKQEIIQKRIQQYRDKKGYLKMKLCIISDSDLHQLISFAKQLNVTKYVQNEAELFAPELYEQMMKSRTKDVRIFQSEKAGMGKTKSITNLCLQTKSKNKKPLIPCFLPISGSISEKEIYERMNEIFQKNNKNNIGLVIQLHNITPQSIKTVNKFLSLICLFKSYSENAKPIYMRQQDRLFIEIENISNFNHFQELNFLKQLHKFHPIEPENQFMQHLIVQEDNQQQKKEISFVLSYLELLRNNRVDSTQTKPFKQYVYRKVDNAKQLIKAFFYDPMVQYVQQTPSYYQYQYFIKLLKESFNVFSTSYYLTKANLDQNKAANPPLYNQLQISSLRSQFLKIIVQNSRQFIVKCVHTRSFEDNGQDIENQFAQRLRNFPFYIMPDVDQTSFSFIYKNPAQVPKAIRNFIIFQDPQMGQQFLKNPANANKMFEDSSSVSAQKDIGKFKTYINQILQNLSNNKQYNVDIQKGYVVNIDNFVKMCLIIQRMRQNIPIVLMGQAGVGKTALFGHVVKFLFKDEMIVLNINAGVKVPELRQYINKIKEKAEQLKKQGQNKRLWIFFDEFNTSQNLGYIKQLICERKFMGEKVQLENVIFVAACNPYRKISRVQPSRMDFFVENAQNNQQSNIAFKVFAPPHSLVDCMWDYGALGKQETKKYVHRMLGQLGLEQDKLLKVVDLILFAGQKIKEWVDKSAASLRDVQRFRKIYKWFNSMLPRVPKIPIIKGVNYLNIDDRAFIMSYIFCFLLRLSTQQKKNILIKQIQKVLDKEPGYVKGIKQMQEKDFYARLKISDDGIASNYSLRQNIFCEFVCIMTKLPLIIVGSPGCSKSLSIRILAQNLIKSRINQEERDQYLKQQSIPNVDSYTFQGSQTCTSEQVTKLFEKASRKQEKRQNNSIPLLIFDQIGLAQKSPDNPLKVLHPWLELSRENIPNFEKRKEVSFIGISNWALDISKMSRFLILQRQKMTDKDLQQTALGISKKYISSQKQKFAQLLSINLAKSYQKFMDFWTHQANRDFIFFFGLRDFYSLIKDIWIMIGHEKVGIEDANKIQKIIYKCIWKNFDGRFGSAKEFIKIYCSLANKMFMQSEVNFTLKDIQILQMNEKGRFPMLIVADQIDVSYLKYKMTNKFPNKVKFLVGSQFKSDKQNKKYILRMLELIKSQVQNGSLLILNKINPSIQTALYDLFNKFYKIKPNGQKVCNITTNNGGTNTCRIHSEFNCIMIISQQQLKETQAPFLNRFEKHQYNVELEKTDMTIQASKKLRLLGDKINKLCQQQQLSYRLDDLVLNWHPSTITALIYKLNLQYPEDGLQQLLYKSLRQLVMNSVQDFYFFFKFYMEQKKNINQQYIQTIRQALQQKKRLIIDTSSIIFGTDRQLVSTRLQKLEAPECTKIQDYVFFKSQSDFTEILQNFYSSEKQKKLQILLDGAQDNKKVSYIESIIQRIRNMKKNNFNVDDKVVFLIFSIDRTRNKNIPIFISYFSSLEQITYEGEIGQFKSSNAQDLFKSFSIKKMLRDAEKHYQFIKEQQNDEKQLQTFMALFQSYKLNLMQQGTILAKICQQVLIKLEGANIKFKDEDIKAVLTNKQLIKRCKNIKQAMTEYISEGKFSLLLKVLIHFLHEKQIFMTLNLNLNLPLLEKQFFDKQELKNIFERQKLDYSELIEKIIQYKFNLIKSKYNDAKRLKRNPAKQIKISRIRLFPFSKLQFDSLFSTTDEKNNLFKHASDFYKQEKSNKNKAINALAAYKNLFNQKSVFIFKDYQDKQVNLYGSIMANPIYKKLFFIDFLVQYLIREKISYKHAFKLYEAISPFFNQYDNAPDSVRFLIAVPQFWSIIFKILNSCYQQKIIPKIIFKPLVNKTSLKDYLTEFLRIFIDQISKKFNLTAQSIRNFKNEQAFYLTFMNVIFHLQTFIKKDSGLQRTTDLHIKRDFLILLDLFDTERKYQLLKEYISQKQQYCIQSKILKYLNNLKSRTNDQNKKKIIMEYLANKLFQQWFKRWDEKNIQSLDQFIKNVNADAVFAHNSVNTLNYLMIQLNDIVFQQLNNVKDQFTQKDHDKRLEILGKNCKDSGFKDNLSVIFVNIFYQQIYAQTQEYNSSQIMTNYMELFEQMYLSCSIDRDQHPMIELFALAFVKFYLYHYIQCLVANTNKDQVQKIGVRINSTSSSFSRTCPFYCLKLLRKKMTMKQIQIRYINVQIFPWRRLIQPFFKQNQSRAYNAPNQDCSQELLDLLKKFEQSQGVSIEILKPIFAKLKQDPKNLYSILNFFMRFMYTGSYQKQTLAKIMPQIQNLCQQYQRQLGNEGKQLLKRYVKSQFDENLKQNVQFNQDDLTILNCLNWFCNSRFDKSPFTSLFFNEDGTFDSEIFKRIDDQFVLCGQENHFITAAVAAHAATASNNIGIYICSGTCDYVYFHQGCGWPSQTSKCPMCGKDIGSAGGHLLQRVAQGARRVTSKQIIDGVGKYYVWSSSPIQLASRYWDGQRQYIKAEIYRMKEKKKTIIQNTQVKITGFGPQSECPSRISNLTARINNFIFSSILYGMISIGVINESNCKNLLKNRGNSLAEGKTYLLHKIRENIRYLKQSLNLQGKFHGWAYGITKQYFKISNQFPKKQKAYKDRMEQNNAKLIAKLRQDIISDNIAKVNYVELYTDIANDLQKGLTTNFFKQLTTFDANKALNRDIFEYELQQIIKNNSNENKFSFANENFQKQGKLQFPQQVLVTQDKISEQHFPYSKIFKLPSSLLKLQDFFVVFEAEIKQKHPLLDFVLKYQDFGKINSFYKVAHFVNKLMQFAQNKITRQQAKNTSLKSFLNDIKTKYGQSVPQVLKKPEKMIVSWVHLAKSLGVLQCKCKVVGTMNNQLTTNSEMINFLIDCNVADNFCGMMMASVFHNFARMHNELINLLNMRKNAIKKYSNLNLVNQNSKLSPQQIKEENVYLVQEGEIERKLAESSVYSIIYGQNVFYYNLEVIQFYFLKKLQGKSQINDMIEKLKSITFNGQAFSTQAESSNTINQVREYGCENLNAESKTKIMQKLKNMKQVNSAEKYYQKLTNIRGNLQSAMIVIRNSKGNAISDTISDLARRYNIETVQQMQDMPFSNILVRNLINLFEIIELELQPMTEKNLDPKFKEPIPNESRQSIIGALKNVDPAFLEIFENALIRYMSRILSSGGGIDENSPLMNYVPYRQDFWPLQYDQQKKDQIQYSSLATVPIKHICGLIDIIQKMKPPKQQMIMR